MIRLQAFGGLSLRGRDGQDLHSVLAQPKRQALLLYLAIALPRGFHRRETLLALFWPELDDAHGRAALSRAIHYLRQSLGNDVVLSRGHDEVGLDWSRIWCDVAGFDAALDRGETAEGLALYQGDLLPGFYVEDAPEFEQWLESERSRLRQRAVQGARVLSEQAEAAGRPRDAIEWARRAVAMSPFDESATRHLMSCLDRTGDRAGALRVFEELQELLRRELDADPAPETVQLAQMIRTRALSPVPPQEPVSVKAQPISTESTSPRKRSHKILPWAAIGFILLALLLISVKRYANIRTNVRSHPATVAILPFTVSGDSSAKKLITELTRGLAAQLDGRGKFRTVRENSQPRYVVRGQVSARADSLQLSATLNDSAAPQPVARAYIEGPAADLDKLLDRIAWQLAAAQAAGLPLSGRRLSALTPSLAAMNLYLNGEKEFVAGEFQAAVRSYHAAVQSDTAFAMAYLSLSRAAAWTGESELASWALNKAWIYSQKLAPLDQFLLRASRAYEGGQVDEAERYLQLILANDPGSAEAWLALGELRYHWGAMVGWTIPQARIAFERSNLMGMNADAIVHLARIAAAEDRVATVDSIITSTNVRGIDPTRRLELEALRAFAGDDDAAQQRVIDQIGKLDDARAYPVILSVVVSTAGHRGTAALARVLQQPERSDIVRSNGVMLLAQLEEIQRGAYEANQALSSFHEVPVRAVEYQAVIASLPITKVPAAEWRRLRDALAALPEDLVPSPPITTNAIYEPARQYLIAMFNLKLGDRRAAASIADKLQTQGEGALDRADRTRFSNLIHAELQRAAGDRRAALEALGPPHVSPGYVFPAVFSYQFAHERFLRAELNRELGNYAEALRWYETFPDPAGNDLMYLPTVKARRRELKTRDITARSAPKNAQAYFDPTTIKAGDTGAGLVLAKRDAVNNRQSPVGATGSFQFRGEVELHGGYRAHFDYPEVQKPCFWVDREDWYKMPRVEKETRIVWFCFANDDAAVKQLGPLSKDTTRAVIVIDDYTTNLFESDVWDTARLVRVITKSTPQ